MSHRIDRVVKREAPVFPNRIANKNPSLWTMPLPIMGYYIRLRPSIRKEGLIAVELEQNMTDFPEFRLAGTS